MCTIGLNTGTTSTGNNAVGAANVNLGIDSTQAAQCNAIFTAYGANSTTSPDGAYPIKPTAAAEFEDYCVMSNATSGGNGGGWTLAMKMDGTSVTWSYNSPNWTTNGITLNPTSTDLTQSNAQFSSYSTVPLTVGILASFAAEGARQASGTSSAVCR